jgi:hypothetical protein
MENGGSDIEFPKECLSSQYSEWLARERRFRIKLLESSPVIRNSGELRVCTKCEEICLCHENNCPNCNSDSIEQRKIEIDDMSFIKKRIRCKYRYQNLLSRA